MHCTFKYLDGSCLIQHIQLLLHCGCWFQFALCNGNIVSAPLFEYLNQTVLTAAAVEVLTTVQH